MNTPLKLDDLSEAKMQRRKEHPRAEMSWFADVDGSKVSYQVSDTDAWNYDVENGLPVRIQVTGELTCKIVTRLRQNKRYVQIEDPHKK